MALMVGDKQSNNLRHFCKICKKGFGCGRALGGHMRAHGLRDDGGGMDDDDDAASEWDGGRDVNVPPSSKKMYALRTNPNRLKNRVCENCGKELLSWKSFLEHGIGKCVSDDADESFVSSDGNDMSDGGGGDGRRGCGNSFKRKRSSGTNKAGSFNNNDKNNNPNCSSSNEEEDLGAANCLMMLSNATVEAGESSALAMSKDEERRRDPNLSFMVPKSQHVPSDHHHNKAKEVGNNNNNTNNNKGLFECKACKKVFNSHQALGGHRASHKKVKGCFAARLDNLDDTRADDDVITHEDQLFPTNNKSNTLHFDHHGSNKNNNNTSSSSNRKSKVHECSICYRVFSSGQALGGHKRCHWITSNAPDTTALARFQQFQEQIEQHMKSNEVVVPKKFDVVDSDPIDLKLDLNLPAPSPDSSHRRNVSTEIYLPSWVGGRVVKELHKDDNTSQSHQMDKNNNGEECKNNSNKNLNISNGSTIQNGAVVEDDEADSKVKLAKFSELKDMTEEGSSSAWLQVGIGSSTTTDDVGTDP